MIFIIESGFFAVLMFAGQGLAAYVLNEEEFVDIINYFFIVSLMRAVMASLVLEPMLGAKERGQDVIEYLLPGISLVLIFSFLPVGYYFSSFSLTMHVAVVICIVLDAFFMFSRRLKIIEDKPKQLISMYGLMAFTYIFLLVPNLNAQLYIIVIGGSLSISAIYVWYHRSQKNADIVEKFRRYGLLKLLRNIVSTRAMQSTYINLSFFLSGSLYLLYFQILEQETLLAFCKVLALYQAPLLIMSGAISNTVLSGRLNEVSKKLLLAILALLGACLLALIGFTLAPSNLIPDLGSFELLALTASIVFFSASNAIMGIFLSPLRREGRLGTISRYLFMAIAISTGSLAMAVVVDLGVITPFVTSSTFFVVMIWLVRHR